MTTSTCDKLRSTNCEATCDRFCSPQRTRVTTARICRNSPRFARDRLKNPRGCNTSRCPQRPGGPPLSSAASAAGRHRPSHQKENRSRDGGLQILLPTKLTQNKNTIGMVFLAADAVLGRRCWSLRCVLGDRLRLHEAFDLEEPVPASVGTRLGVLSEGKKHCCFFPFHLFRTSWCRRCGGQPGSRSWRPRGSSGFLAWTTRGSLWISRAGACTWGSSSRRRPSHGFWWTREPSPISASSTSDPRIRIFGLCWTTGGGAWLQVWAEDSSGLRCGPGAPWRNRGSSCSRGLCRKCFRAF